MDNVTYEVKGSKLLVTVDISAAKIKAAQPSSTGNSRLVASTRGAVPIDGSSGLKLSLNLTTPKSPSAS